MSSSTTSSASTIAVNDDGESRRLIVLNPEKRGKLSTPRRLQLCLVNGMLVIAVAPLCVVAARELTLSTVHMLAMGAFMILISNAILLLQSSTATTRISRTRTHTLLNVIAVVTLIVGCAVMYVNKHNHASVHLRTYHGKLGFSACLFALAVAMAGWIARFAPGVCGGAGKARKVAYPAHRVAGYVALGLLFATAAMGARSDSLVNRLGGEVTIGMAVAIG
ncbi:hypothetical protein HK101_005697, partial [Irineochytrium annulatum]